MSLTTSRLTVTKLARYVSYVGYSFVLVAEAILAIGFLLKLLGANPDASFTEWAYRSLERVMAPFRGIFEPVTFENSDSILDVSILFAMFVYGLVAVALQALLDVLTARSARLEQRAFLEAGQARSETAEAGQDRREPPIA